MSSPGSSSLLNALLRLIHKTLRCILPICKPRLPNGLLSSQNMKMTLLNTRQLSMSLSSACFYSLSIIIGKSQAMEGRKLLPTEQRQDDISPKRLLWQDLLMKNPLIVS